MATFAGGEKLEAYLADKARKIASGKAVRVGFLEGATYPDGTSVATVAAIQNFGAPARGIPPRPFFSNVVAEKGPRWGDQLIKVLDAADGDAALALNRMGAFIAGQVVQSIRDTNDPKLADETVRRKGFAKPLVDTGVMIQSVDYEVEE